MEVLIQTANRTLARKGFSPDEASVVSSSPDSRTGTLRGGLIAREMTDLVANLMRIVDWLPERDELVEVLQPDP